jgi:hypothetical protein
VRSKPVFRASESKALIHWPRSGPSKGLILPVTLFAVCIAAITFIYEGKSPATIALACAIAAVVTPAVLFALRWLLSRGPGPTPLVLDADGMLGQTTTGDVYVPWREVTRLTHDVGVVARRRPPYFAYLLTAQKSTGESIEYRMPPLTLEEAVQLRGILDEISHRHRFLFRYLDPVQARDQLRGMADGARRNGFRDRDDRY